MADGVVLEFYVSEVLCFCKNYLGKVPKGEIVEVLVGFSDDKEIVCCLHWRIKVFIHS